MRRGCATAPWPRGGLGLLLVLGCLLGLLAGCETTGQDVYIPARLLYLEAESHENSGLYSEAVNKYQQITQQYPGTRLATFAYLKLGEVLSRQQEWVQADTNYRLFLNLNANSHLTPYVLARLLKVNHERSYTGIVFKAREVDRDMAPNRQIMLEFKRFFLLYPKSIYMDEVLPFYRDARDSLAMYEMVVGDFYFNRGQFNAAAGRYTYLLRNFPEFPESERVVEKLIRAYEQDQQPDLAEEIRRIQLRRLKAAPPEPDDASAHLTTAEGNVAMISAPTIPERP